MAAPAPPDGPPLSSPPAPPGTGRPVVAVIAVVPRNGRVLLVRRRNRPDAGRWGFPGGKIEPGETVFAAAVRELAEETGITADPLEVLDALDVIDRAPDGALIHHYVLIAVLCRWRAGEGAAADDAEEAAWLTLKDIEAAGPRGTSPDVDRIAALALGRASA